MKMPRWMIILPCAALLLPFSQAGAALPTYAERLNLPQEPSGLQTQLILAADHAANPPIAVHLNGLKLQLTHMPMMNGGKIYIPLRDVLEAAGWSLTWYAQGQTITAQKNTGQRNRSLKISIGYAKGAFNGEMQDLADAPMLIGDTAYLQAGDLQRIGMKLDWDESKRVVILEEQQAAQTFTYLNGSRYDGELWGRVPNGKGKLFSKEGALLYEGEFMNGLADGEGKQYGKQGHLVYSGGFDHDRKHGYGSLYREDGSLEYTGIFSFGEQTGSGVHYLTNGMKVLRQLDNDAFPARPTLVYPNGVRFEGMISDGVAEGEGRLVALSGAVLAEGRFIGGKLTLNDMAAGTMREVTVSNDGFYQITTKGGSMKHYVNEAHGFGINFPGSWAEQPLKVIEGPGKVSFFYGNDWLMAIKQYTVQEWNAIPGRTPDGAVLLQQEGGLVYGYVAGENEAMPGGITPEETSMIKRLRSELGGAVQSFRLLPEEAAVKPGDLKLTDKEIWSKFARIERWTLNTAGSYPEGVRLNERDKQLIVSRLSGVYDEDMAKAFFERQNRKVDGGYETIPIDYTSITSIGDGLQVKQAAEGGRITVTIAGGDVEVQYMLDSASYRITGYKVLRSNY